MMIAEAAKKLEKARLQLDHAEALFFEGRCTQDALREAWNERETARLALERAHIAAGAVTR
jgi:hypothetical protein